MTAKTRTLVKWIGLVALLSYSVFMAAWAATEVRSRACKGLKVEILPAADGHPSFLTPKAVERELGDLPLKAKGTPLSAINTDALEKHLLQVNNFENVECVVTSGGYLLVRVLPIVPEARIFTPAGTYYINRDGKRLDAHAEYYANLPVVRGNFTAKMPARGVLPIVRFIQQDSLLHNLVSMIDYRSPTNIILIPRIRGHVINFGDTTRLQEKAALLSTFYRKVMPNTGWGVYDTISVKFRGQVVATRADKRRAIHSTQFDDEDPDPEEAAAVADTGEINTPPSEPVSESIELKPEPKTEPAKKNSDKKNSPKKDTPKKDTPKKEPAKRNQRKRLNLISR